MFTALVELYGHEKWHEWIEARTEAGIKKLIDDECQKNGEDNRQWMTERYNSDWYKNELPFYIYDLENKDDREAAEKLWGQLLSQWDQRTCADGWSEVHDNSVKFQYFLDSINSAYSVYLHQGTDDELKTAGTTRYKLWNSWQKLHLKCNALNRWVYQHLCRVPMPENLKAVVRDVRSRLNIMTNLDVLRLPDSRFFIHFEDNLILNLQDVDEPGRADVDNGILSEEEKTAASKSKYITAADSSARVMELLLNKLIELKHIDVADKELRELYKGHFSEDWKKANPEVISWLEGDRYNIKDFINETIATCNEHEG